MNYICLAFSSLPSVHSQLRTNHCTARNISQSFADLVGLLIWFQKTRLTRTDTDCPKYIHNMLYSAPLVGLFVMFYS